MNSQNNKGGKNAYLIILSIITVACILVGAMWHIGGFFGKGFKGFKGFNFNLGNVVTWSDPGDNVHEKANLDAFDSIDVSLGIGEFILKEGSSYEISYDYPEKWVPEYSISGKKLTVKHPKHLSFNTAGSVDAKVVITVPKGTVLDEIDVNCSLGDIDISDVNCERYDIDESLGEITVKNVTCDDMFADNSLGSIQLINVNANKLEANLSMGDLTVKDSDIDTVDCGNSMGSVEFEGKCKSLNIDNSMGDIKVTTDSDWKGKLQTDMGEIEYNGENYGTKLKR